MKAFTKKEIVATLIILAFLLAVSFKNFQISLRRARDAQRKADLGNISNALHLYAEDFGFYPPSSSDGKIIACKKEGVSLENLDSNLTLEERLKEIFAPCQWGEDKLMDVSDPSYPLYLDKLPVDPDSHLGATYRYNSNLKRFQLFASLEGKDEAEFQEEIEKRGLTCGHRICNFGKSSGITPLDKSIEEYENEIMK